MDLSTLPISELGELPISTLLAIVLLVGLVVIGGPLFAFSRILSRAFDAQAAALAEERKVRQADKNVNDERYTLALEKHDLLSKRIQSLDRDLDRARQELTESVRTAKAQEVMIRQLRGEIDGLKRQLLLSQQHANESTAEAERLKIENLRLRDQVEGLESKVKLLQARISELEKIKTGELRRTNSSEAETLPESAILEAAPESH